MPAPIKPSLEKIPPQGVELQAAPKLPALPPILSLKADHAKTAEKIDTARLDSLVKSLGNQKASNDGLPQSVRDNSNSFSIKGVRIHQPLDRKSLEFFKDNNSKYIFVESREGRGFVAWSQVEKLNQATQQDGKQTLSYPPVPPIKEFVRMYMDSSFGKALSEPTQ